MIKKLAILSLLSIFIFIVICLKSKTKRILLFLFLLFVSVFIKMCVKYEPKNSYYMYSDSKNLNEEKLKEIYISGDEIMFINLDEINKHLILRKISLIYNNLKLGEVVVDKKIKDILEGNSYYISEDIIKILGKDYNKIRQNSEEYLQGKEFEIILILENTDKKKLYEIKFKNVNVYYRRKGFDIWILNI